MASIPAPFFSVSHIVWADTARAGTRDIAEEVPVALVYDASTEAVMMATPADLEDFAYGFSLTEGLISKPEDIRRLDIVPGPNGVEARMWLTPERGQLMTARRRSRTGPTGCGLCGLDSLEEVLRLRVPIGPSALQMTASDILNAVTSLETRQPLGEQTRAVHAAGFWSPGEGLVAVREDVGRHNALDKLAGTLARTGVRGDSGAIVLTSRVSVEMVQKAAAIGAPVLIAISAPTALALRTAEAAGLTVIAVARHNGFEVFTHPERIVLTESSTL
ncbi:formate dehydrogenase accessory sulfurtransferase FdhD [Asticcacaulis taihuensis]|uniref:formate dehydrogenase accessory sulfurtransferase FdhD n=1 Tax=Asticcacaulis taihuensis TaxID=260084 RepID=UPI003F7CD3A5